MGRRLLTLAITYNVKTNNYSVICFDYSKAQIIPLELSKEDIESKHSIYFDIGAITEVEKLREGEINYPVGNREITQNLSRLEIKKLLSVKQTNFARFHKLQGKNTCGIIKVDRIMDMNINKTSREELLPVVSFVAGGNRHKNMYINDYRWVQYIRYISEKNQIKELDKYKEFLNNKEKELYFIINKYDKGKLYVWGIHYL